METFFIVARIAHIFTGSLAFIAGFLAIIAPKGKTLHRMAGIVYVFSMIGVAATAMLMSLVKTELLSFFAPLSAFTLQLTLGGWRALERKRFSGKEPQKGRSLTPKIDWAIAFGSLGSGCVFLALGARQIWLGNATGAVSVVFGGIGVSLAAKNLRLFFLADRGVTPEKMEWFFAHISGMLGAYIATVTAVLVVNGGGIPEVPRWLAPTVVGSFGIAFWTRSYKRRFARVEALKRGREAAENTQRFREIGDIA